MSMRRVLPSPVEGGGVEEKGAESGGREAPAAQSKGPEAPAPVPYDVFKQTNEKLREAEATASKLQSEIQGYEGWRAPKEVEDLLAQERSKGEQLVLLADKGVAPKYRGYMLDRLGEAKPDDPAGYLDQLRATESAFFGASTTSDSAPANRTPPKSNPDGGAGSSSPGDGRPVTAADIDAMSVAEYIAWRDGGGLDRIRAQGPASS